MAGDRAIRVMIVDDHAIVRNGIRLSLLAFDDLELVAEAKDCQETLAACDRLRDAEALPDVVVMDMLMPGTDGVATTRALLERHPTVRVIALASFDTEVLVQDAVGAGAMGYLPKAAPSSNSSWGQSRSRSRSRTTGTALIRPWSRG
jgi:DNA-binding NarL/FixJ family response regulator